jgi:hypothetical protein
MRRLRQRRSPILGFTTASGRRPPTPARLMLTHSRGKNVLWIEIEARQIRHDMLRQLPSVDYRAALYGILSNFLFVCILPLLKPQGRGGDLLRFLDAHFERASPLPPTDPRGAPDVACAGGVQKVI